jgi:hypothetical protein
MAYTEYSSTRTPSRLWWQNAPPALRANRGFSNLLGFGLGVVAERLQKDPAPLPRLLARTGGR